MAAYKDYNMKQSLQNRISDWKMVEEDGQKYIQGRIKDKKVSFKCSEEDQNIYRQLGFENVIQNVEMIVNEKGNHDRMVFKEPNQLIITLGQLKKSKKPINITLFLHQNKQRLKEQTISQRLLQKMAKFQQKLREQHENMQRLQRRRQGEMFRLELQNYDLKIRVNELEMRLDRQEQISIERSQLVKYEMIRYQEEITQILKNVEENSMSLVKIDQEQSSIIPSNEDISQNPSIIKLFDKEQNEKQETL